MKNTFRYALSFEDYLNFEKFSYKVRKTGTASVLLIMLATGYLVYTVIRYKTLSPEYYFYYGVVVVTLIASIIFSSKIAPKTRVKRYTTKDSSYFSTNEITVDEKTVEIKNIPEENQAGMVCVYPYTVMNAVYETEKYFYFLVGSEVKILPKDAVPNEMKAVVFRDIKSNPNCIFVK